MENNNIIFLTNKEADLEYFNGLRTINRDIENSEVEYCRLIDNFAYAKIKNSYRFYDQFVATNKKLTDSGKTMIDQIEEKAFNKKYDTTIVAVHWGEKSETEIKKYLLDVNKKNTESKYKFSYWGSQSHSYKKKILSKIIAEIIGLAKIYESDIIAEIEEAIQIFDKSNQLIIDERKKIILQIDQSIQKNSSADLNLNKEFNKIIALENIRNHNKTALEELEKIIKADLGTNEN